jgi:DNA repair exonuclease SbcCD ATPase subunit
MMNLISSLPSSALPSTDSREGLPYWIFWFLLCVIMLLVTFIFLRDKELRQKLNSFLFSARKKLIKFQLQSRLRKENRKKDALIKELGKKTWEKGIRVDGGKKIEIKLNKLEKNRIRFQKQLDDIASRIEMLNGQFQKSEQKHGDQIKEQEIKIKPQRDKLTEINEKERLIRLDILQKKKGIDEVEKNMKAAEKETEELEAGSTFFDEKKKAKRAELEEKMKDREKKKEEIQIEIQSLREEKTRLEREQKNLQGSISDSEKKIKEIEEVKIEGRHEFQKKIREWEKSKEKVLVILREVEKEKEPLFESFGKLIDKHRIENEELAVFYSQIDRADKRIQNIEKQIQNL